MTKPRTYLLFRENRETRRALSSSTSHRQGSEAISHLLHCQSQVLIESKYSTVICAPVYTAYDGLATQVSLDVADGMKHPCGIHCDNLVSLQKSVLTNFVATLSDEKISELNQALAIALGLPG